MGSGPKEYHRPIRATSRAHSKLGLNIRLFRDFIGTVSVIFQFASIHERGNVTAGLRIVVSEVVIENTNPMRRYGPRSLLNTRAGPDHHAGGAQQHHGTAQRHRNARTDQRLNHFDVGAQSRDQFADATA